ncbi:MAG: acyl carrier protein [Halioglobus sp.]|jgi:acyl carrier protein
MSNEIYQQVETIFRAMLTDRQMEAMNPDATMDDVDGWDSLSFLDMIMGLEGAFNIRIDGLEAVNLTTVPNITEYLQSHT